MHHGFGGEIDYFGWFLDDFPGFLMILRLFSRVLNVFCANLQVPGVSYTTLCASPESIARWREPRGCDGDRVT